MHPDPNRDLLALTPMWQWVGTPRFSKACLAKAIFIEEVRLYLEYRECLERQKSEQHEGDMSKMEGVVELAEEIFHMPVRLGAPQNIQGLKDIVNNPIYSTGVGLLLYGKEQGGARNDSPERTGSAVDRFIAWIKKNF